MRRRMPSESEPPNLATENKAGRSTGSAWKPRSPVRIREGAFAKTTRKRANFSAWPSMRAHSLRDRRLVGGGSRLGRTRLSGLNP